MLIWAGGGGDDLAKSPHLVRIANSVYRGLCPDGLTLRSFGFYSEGKPSPMMELSLLYNPNQNGIVPSVEVDRNRFRQVHMPKHKRLKCIRHYQCIKNPNNGLLIIENVTFLDHVLSWSTPTCIEKSFK